MLRHVGLMSRMVASALIPPAIVKGAAGLPARRSPLPSRYSCDGFATVVLFLGWNAIFDSRPRLGKCKSVVSGVGVLRETFNF